MQKRKVACSKRSLEVTPKKDTRKRQAIFSTPKKIG
jgi:hypothetical protein